jgi:hypothetical protein
MSNGAPLDVFLARIDREKDFDRAAPMPEDL